ncbi:uncharacterized protein K452DRAFT_341303 [Aplosporella prunicola CBS 121167]|uniref:Uncharacterized protein n=1 Tax=Aplosporella prunicola CBS 121167 TaxID=1176127 RepID=A0A6A6B2S7_9PEZI|nr:uncharacterized protein K452DRAFT_341303 [Aplosporella prunicola CBS 121167]KAF2137317.1 hypothetical protein K452DRAFT_341303 [Aplosporella prunicola CBS 121167]
MAAARHKIIVGLDYGTTYLGISYVTSNEKSFDKIEVINQWPGTPESVFKVPTRIAYAFENENLTTNQWGYTATPNMEPYLWTKLLLDRNTKLTDYDDPTLDDLLGKGIMRLPESKSAREVCSNFLKCLCEHMVAVLTKKYSSRIFDITPVEVWITLPAIWSDAARDATKSAAMSAASHHESALDPISPGDDILVCDCGGGTVDITTYNIISCRPKLEFKELCVGIGGKCGSTSIDRNFNIWMLKTFGKAYENVQPKRRGPGSNFMRSFETAKRTFSGDFPNADGMQDIEVEHINMKTLSTPKYDADEATLKFSCMDMKAFFDPVIDDIIRLVKSQVKHAKSNNHNIKRIILNGQIQLTCPPQCQAAVVKGAAIRGLEGLKPRSRQARRHYGYGIALPFRKHADPEWLGYIDNFNGQKYCKGRMNWQVSKGQNLEDGAVMKSAVQFKFEDKELTKHITLWSCNEDIAPEYSHRATVQKVGEVQVVFQKKDLKNARRKHNKSLKKYVREVDGNIEVNMATEQCTLTVKTFVNDREAGQATIDFLQD